MSSSRPLANVSFVLAILSGSAFCCQPVRADEKGDVLLRQVQTAAHALQPLVGEYTVTVHGKSGDTISKCKQFLNMGGRGWQGSRDLPQQVFNLFEPIVQTGAPTRYLGKQTVDGQTYDVVELKLSSCTLQLFLGSDNLIYRAHATLGSSSHADIGNPIDPKTGKLLTPAQLQAARIRPASEKASNSIDAVVTSYHKVRTFNPYPDLPAETRSLPLKLKNNFALAITLAPHGGLAAVRSNDNAIQIRDTVTGAETATLENTPANVQSIAFSPDGSRLAVLGQTVGGIWEVATGKQVCGLAVQNLQGNNAPVQEISFSPDGSKLAGVSRGGSVYFWKGETGEELPTLQAVNTRSFAFSPDGNTLATINTDFGGKGTPSPTVTLWDLASLKPLHTYEWKSGLPATLVFAPNGKWLAVTGFEGGVLILEGMTCEKIQELPTDGSRVSLLHFSADSKSLVAMGVDTRGDEPTYQPGVLIWNTANWQIAHRYGLPITGIFMQPGQASISEDGYTIAVLEIFGKAPKVWTLPNE